MGSVVHVYDGNGDEVLTYTAGVGWHEKEINVGGGAGDMEVQGGFDARE